ncbi:MAG: hypothetical protein BGO11_11620 [Solirubrobacterales bacterium 70-9]|nr:MAG: hypothetical protein BGO11_11620 [Solirubrobacterales bacterium 70-9]
MLVLVTGGTGTTGSRVSAGVEELGHQARRAGRRAPSADAGGEHVLFDWAKAETHGPALEGVEAVYLLPPVGVADPAPMMLPFIDRALTAGVSRFVLLSASVIPEGSPGVGTVHEALRQRVGEWAVLQPSWFMQNFTGSHPYAESIRSESSIATSTGDARVSFVDADDIAAVAVRSLLDSQSHNRAHVITGPEALSYGEVAAIVSDAAGRPVRHLDVDPADVQRSLIAAGLPEAFAEILVNLEGVVRSGAEDRVTDTVESITGRPPISFRAHAEANAQAFAERG